jgi:hypothetical protein
MIRPGSDPRPKRNSRLVERLREPRNLLRDFIAHSDSAVNGALKWSAAMSNLIHSREYLHQGDIVIVNCDHQCNVRVMDDSNFNSYRSGGRHNYHGGFYRMLPARIPVPNDGYWNVTIDLGGGRANIRYSINYLKREAA